MRLSGQGAPTVGTPQTGNGGGGALLMFQQGGSGIVIVKMQYAVIEE
jgi:hypothetical protein